MKKIIFLLFIFLSTSVYANKFQTNAQGVYMKNFSCTGGMAGFNIVNKSLKDVKSITVIVYDSDNDPIDSATKYVYVESGSGMRAAVFIDCANSKSIGFKVSQ